MAEETVALAVKGRSNPEWLSDDTTARLLECVPTANLPREAMAAKWPRPCNSGTAPAAAQRPGPGACPNPAGRPPRVREAARDVGQYSVSPLPAGGRDGRLRAARRFMTILASNAFTGKREQLSNSSFLAAAAQPLFTSRTPRPSKSAGVARDQFRSCCSAVAASRLSMAGSGRFALPCRRSQRSAVRVHRQHAAPKNRGSSTPASPAAPPGGIAPQPLDAFAGSRPASASLRYSAWGGPLMPPRASGACAATRQHIGIHQIAHCPPPRGLRSRSSANSSSPCRASGA